MKGLIVERHAWETSAGRHQVQFPREAFTGFFGTGGTIAVRVFSSPWLRKPTREASVTLGEYKKPSGTYRINGVYELANLGPVFVCINEYELDGALRTYDLWWERDLALVAARFDGWRKAKKSQYGRGRLWLIHDDPIERPIEWE